MKRMHWSLFVGRILFWWTLLIMPSVAEIPATQLTVYVDAENEPVIDRVASRFQKQTGVQVSVMYGGSVSLLNIMKTMKAGDLYISSTVFYTQAACTHQLIDPASRLPLFYFVPVLCVCAGNPLQLERLNDLLRDDVRVAIANPEKTGLGVMTAEILDNSLQSGDIQRFQKKCQIRVDNAMQLADLLTKGEVDAVIGWTVFETWHPQKIDVIPIPYFQLSRLGYAEISLTTFGKQPKISRQFIEFVRSDMRNVEFYQRKHYIMTKEMAWNCAGGQLPFSELYGLPSRWIKSRRQSILKFSCPCCAPQTP